MFSIPLNMFESDAIVYSFKGGDDGKSPQAAVRIFGGTLYGTTAEGGSQSGCNGSGCGTVFSVTPTGKEAVLYGFKGGATDGQGPLAPLISVKGVLYGTTYGGGHDSCDEPCGTVFSVTTSGSEKVRHFFDFDDGAGGQPADGLLDVGGTLFGTVSGGQFYCGAIFHITNSGDYSVVHRFGSHPPCL